MYGGKYTWLGKRYAHDVKKRIDRALANADWQDMFPTTYIKALHWLSSDHRPLLIYTELQQWQGRKLFCYDNRWHLHPQFKEFVEYNWRVECACLPPKKFHEAIKRCRHKLAEWKSSHNSNSKKRISELKELLHRGLEEEYWRAKSRVLWLQAGDQNTSDTVEDFLQPLQPRVTPDINQHLTKPVTEEEIYATVRQMNVDKIPRF